MKRLLFLCMALLSISLIGRSQSDHNSENSKYPGLDKHFWGVNILSLNLEYDYAINPKFTIGGESGINMTGARGISTGDSYDVTLYYNPMVKVRLRYYPSKIQLYTRKYPNQGLYFGLRGEYRFPGFIPNDLFQTLDWDNDFLSLSVGYKRKFLSWAYYDLNLYYGTSLHLNSYANIPRIELKLGFYL